MMEVKNQPLHDILQELPAIPKTQTVKHTLKKISCSAKYTL